MSTPTSPRHARPPTLRINGLDVFCHGALAVADSWKHRLRFLSIAGPREVVKGVFASILTGGGTSLELEQAPATSPWAHQTVAFAIPDPTTLQTLTRRLPSGQVHGLLFSKTAAAAHADIPFTMLLPHDHAAQAPLRLLTALDRRTDLPLHSDWANWLWTTGLAYGSIEPLEGFGPWAGWEIDLDPDALTESVQDAIRSNALPLPGQLTLRMSPQ